MVQFNFKFAFPGTNGGPVESAIVLERPEDLAGLSLSIPDYTARTQLVSFVKQLMQQASDAGVAAGRAEARKEHEADIAKIGGRLIQEAEDRDWCETYDGVINDLNQALAVKLPLRMTDFDVSITYMVTTVQAIQAQDASAAEREAYDSLGASRLTLDPVLVDDYGLRISSVEFDSVETN